jgi:hypothetical protein
MFIYSDSLSPARNYGTDTAQRTMAETDAKYATHIEGPDSIGCYLVTFDNGLQLEISRGEQVCSPVGTIRPSMPLFNRSAIKAWLAAALRDNARRKGLAAIETSESGNAAYNEYVAA